jgi:hypothetical protein
MGVQCIGILITPNIGVYNMNQFKFNDSKYALLLIRTMAELLFPEYKRITFDDRLNLFKFKRRWWSLRSTRLSIMDLLLNELPSRLSQYRWHNNDLLKHYREQCCNVLNERTTVKTSRGNVTLTNNVDTVLKYLFHEFQKSTTYANPFEERCSIHMPGNTVIVNQKIIRALSFRSSQEVVPVIHRRFLRQKKVPYSDDTIKRVTLLFSQ